MLATLVVVIPRLKKNQSDSPLSDGWLIFVGLSYVGLCAFYLQSAPDARFFSGGILFCAIPLCNRARKFPLSKIWVPAFFLAASVQSSAVLFKVHQLRNIPQGVIEAIDYLDNHPDPIESVFMYPEGSYRLFPVPHEWYFNNRLQEFWLSDNDHRIEMLNQYNLWGIVIKKYLIGTIDPEMNNLRIYPDFFVEQIKADDRFQLEYSNDDIDIYTIPNWRPQAVRDAEEAAAKRN